MKLDQIIKSAEAFEKLAAIDFADVCKNYSSALQAEAQGGLRAVAKLLPANPNSMGLKQLNKTFKEVMNSVSNLEPMGASIALRDLRSSIGHATFYTSSTNTGTGFESVTRTGGAWSPSAYLNRIITHVDKFEKWHNYYEQQNGVKPSRHDPSLPNT